MADDRLEFTPDADLLRQIDEWRGLQGSKPTRTQAVAELIKAGLRGQAASSVSLGEKLILSVLCDVSRKVGSEGMIDPDFLDAAIKGGHSWAIEWQHPSLAHGHTNSQNTADMVSRVLAMWRLIEESFDKLSPEDQDRIKGEAGLAGPARFPGWDSELEANFKSTSRFMTDQMSLFPMFAGRSAADSGRPVLARYKRMLDYLAGLPRKGSEQKLDASELSGLLAIE